MKLNKHLARLIDTIEDDCITLRHHASYGYVCQACSTLVTRLWKLGIKYRERSV